MEKLELKHIVGYLPYGLQIKCGDITRAKLTLDKVTSELISVKEILINNAFKPILRPLSGLTKEIEVNGERFVPVEWFEIGDDENNSEEYDHGNIKLIKTLESISKFNIQNDISYLPYGVVKKLYEWHFDIHGLIEKGLAIDINTLTNGIQ